MRLPLSIFILLTSTSVYVFSQAEKKIEELSKNTFNSLKTGSKTDFLKSFPDKEDIKHYLEKNNQESSEEIIQTTFEEILTKAEENFEQLMQIKKELGTTWDTFEFSEVLFEEITPQTGKIDVLIDLEHPDHDLQLKLDDIVKIKDGVWKITDDISVVMEDASIEEEDEVVSGNQPEVPNQQIVGMIKYTINDLKNNKPTEVEDDVINDAEPFMPPDGQRDMSKLDSFFNNPEDRFTFSYNQEGTYINEEEIWLNVLNIKMGYLEFPDFKNTSASLEVEKVTDKNGEQLLIDDETMAEYEEQGIIEAPSFYMNYPEIEEKIYLTRELKYGEELTMTGKLYWYFPLTYKSVTFSSKDIGAEKEIEGFKIKLLDLDRNIARCEVSGKNFGFDQISKMFVNDELKPFNNITSTGIPKPLYEKIISNNYQLSDDQINEFASGYDPYAQVPKVYTFRVSGNIHKIAFYKALERSEKTIEVIKSFKVN